MRLAIDGGTPALTTPIRPFRTIGPEEINHATATLRAGVLSGYMGGVMSGGMRCEALEYEFAGMVGAKHAIAVNSATSGLLVACMACGVERGTEVRVTPYTMSATAAAPAFLGANLIFNDIGPRWYGMGGLISTRTKAMIVTNLFGHPAALAELKRQCAGTKTYLIEDNAQSPFAMEGTKYAGTVGDIGVFSFNVHKHLQCGEGGICVTDNETLAHRMRLFRNHAELSDHKMVGMNLRMTEVTASIALAQLAKREQIIAGRIELAEELTHMAKGIPGLQLPSVREACKHVYYCWAIQCEHDREWFVRAMNAEGVPMKAGYVTPLYNLPAFSRFKRNNGFPVTEEVESKIALFEVCGYDPGRRHLKSIGEAFAKVGEVYEKRALGPEFWDIKDCKFSSNFEWRR